MNPCVWLCSFDFCIFDVVKKKTGWLLKLIQVPLLPLFIELNFPPADTLARFVFFSFYPRSLSSAVCFLRALQFPQLCEEGEED